jgi:hypothetical protein
MQRHAMALLFAIACASPLHAASFYTEKPNDPDLLILDKNHFPTLHADGTSDDTGTLQQAINQAGANNQVLLIPQARYLISKTIGIPGGTRVIGFGQQRPVLILAPHTPGFDTNAPKYMIWFSGGGDGRRRGGTSRPATTNPTFSDASAGTFYSGLSNIDFDIGEGNPAAVAIRAHYAQHGILTHIDFHLGSALAGIEEVGNEAEDLHFHGGDYAIISTGTSPSWQFTLLDSSFDGQRTAAFKTHTTGLTLIRDQFLNTPTVISIDPDERERLWMKDCTFSDITGPALIIGEENNVRTQINLEDIFCHNVPQIALYRPSGKQVPSNSSADYQLHQFRYGLQIPDLGAPPAITQTLVVQASKPAPIPSDIPALPPMNTWATITSFGAKGDGTTDDLPAFNAAIAHAKAIFLPHGRYRVTDTIHLHPDTILIGLNPITTQIAIDDNAPAFATLSAPGAYHGVIESSPAGTNILTGIGLDAGANNPAAAALKWTASRNSMVNDVKFLGGHGTSRADHRRGAPIYNADHSGDGDPTRHWDSTGPGLWVTDHGGGTFANIWTASTFSNAGMLVENTTTPSRVYELSSEHHVRNEIIFRNVSNWEIYAQQTEEEWGEGEKCLPLEIMNCTNLTFANTILFRVFGITDPFADGARIADSHNICFLGVRTYGQSPYNFDNPINDVSLNIAIRSRELGALIISGNPPATDTAPSNPLIAPNATLQKLPGDFISADHAVVDSAGNAYFTDMHQNKIFQYAPDTNQLSVLRDDPIRPFALAVDHADNLIILSHLGKAYTLPLKDPHAALTELTPIDAVAHPGMTAILAADRWWDGGQFLESNARQEPLQFPSPDHTLYLPIPKDYSTGQQHNWTSQPINLYRSYQLSPAIHDRPFYVADENEHKTWSFTPTDNGTLTDPHLFAQHGEAGVITDSAGNVYIADGDLFIYDPTGKQIAFLPIPSRPLSMVFCGQDHHTLLIAARTGVYTLKMTTSGTP